MKLILKPGEKKVVLIALVIMAVVFGIMSVVLHFTPLIMPNSN